MKQLMSLIVMVGFMVGMVTGCTSSGTTQSDTAQNTNQTKEGYFFNENYDAQNMVTIDGSQFHETKNDKMYASPKSGFGITLTQTLFDLKNKGKLDLNAFSGMLELLYVSEDAKNYVADKDPEQMTQEEIQETVQVYLDKNFSIFGVYRRDTLDPLSQEDFAYFESRFEHITSLTTLDNQEYYFGYNTEYAQLNLTEAEKTELAGLLTEREEFQNGLVLFPFVEEETKNVAGDLQTFETTTLNGETVNQELFQNYDLTMVNIWATWCNPCVSELPELQKLKEKLPDNVNLITICADGQEEQETAKQILSSFDGTYPVLLPSDSLTTQLLSGVQTFPTTIFVDRKGVPVGSAVIGVPGQQTSVVDAYLKEVNQRLQP